jgi:hypothetical protein
MAIPFINLLGDKEMKLWRESAKELNQMLSTVVLEDLSRDEVEDLIRESREAAKSKIES